VTTNSTASTGLPDAPTRLLLGGSWRDARDGRVFPVLDPATGSVLAEVADAGPAEGAVALALADDAQAAWAATPPRVRSEVLRRAFELLLERTEQFATVITLEMGKPLAEARGEVSYAAEFLRWFSEEAVRIDGRYTVAPDGASRFLVTRRPVGPSLLISPWNFPLAMAARKVAPALAAGCTAILKPAEATPLTALLFGEVLLEAGLPDGVLSVLPTSTPGALVEPMLGDGRLRKLSFTGSTPVGRMLLAQASTRVLRTSMELGGNAPFLVFDDADLDAAVDGAMLAKARNAGQVCTSANRLYVHESIVADFVRALAERMSALPIGHGLDEGTRLGPLIDERARQKVESLVRDAVERGASIVTGGERLEGAGTFYPPTVLTNVPRDARILAEEVFGPVAPVVPFASEAEAIALANDTEFGLIAYAFTRDLDRGLRLAEAFEVGMLGLNAGVIANPAAPFGGVKESGLGREGGAEGIDEYLETTYVGIGRPR